MAVLDARGVGRAACGRRAGVVGHGVRRAHVLGARIVAAAVADLRLAVPVGVLHEVEHHNGPVHRKVVLPHVAPERVDRASCRRARDVADGLHAARALVGARAMVAAHIHIVALALAVSAVRVRGGDEKARLCRVGDLELHLVARLGPLVPVFRDLDELAARRVVHDLHAAPRQAAVEGGGAVAVVHRRDGIRKARRVVRAAPRGRGGAVPDRAVGLGVLERHGVLLHLVHRHRLRVGLAVERAGHVPGAVGGDVEVAHARRRGLLERG